MGVLPKGLLRYVVILKVDVTPQRGFEDLCRVEAIGLQDTQDADY
jgi:hypothetical protein